MTQCIGASQFAEGPDGRALGEICQFAHQFGDLECPLGIEVKLAVELGLELVCEVEWIVTFGDGQAQPREIHCLAVGVYATRCRSGHLG